MGSCHPTVTATTVPGGLAGVPPPLMYSGALPPAPMQQHPWAVRVTWGAPGRKGEELRRV